MNIYNEAISLCGNNPKTGFLRTGYCTTNQHDQGTHTVCAIVTKEFLVFTYKKGNDLITPRTNFPGLKPGDRWCLCALRWLEAYKAGVAPYIDLKATDIHTLKYINKEILKKYGI